MDHQTNRLPGLLGKLGQMTSIRDTELLEQSLLRTLGPLLGVLDTSLYRVDERFGFSRATYCHRSKVIEGAAVERVVERIEQVLNPGDVEADVLTVTDNVRLLTKPCTKRLDSDFLIAYPLFAANEVCGFFVFQRDREVSANEDTMIRGVLEVFSNYYALLDVSLRDRLTGLLNRQALESSFERIWMALGQHEVRIQDDSERRKLAASNYWLAVIDIDRFKNINDTFGHMVGDEILLLAARLMENTFRATDLLYRYGGEEFVAIIAAENEAIAENVFERVRLAVEAHSFPRVETLTISVGYARVSADVLPVETLSRADRCLYQAKQDGRNRIYEYGQLLRAGIFQEIACAEPEFF